MNNVNLELGTLIKDYRLALNLTQSDLAEKLAYDSTQFVSLFERGLAKVPFNVLGKLVVILGIPEKKILKILTTAFDKNLRQQMNEGKRELTA